MIKGLSPAAAIEMYSKAVYNRARTEQTKGYVLKPCPFCGERIIKVHYRLIENLPHYWVKCENLKGCKVNPQTYNFGTEQEAIYAWNERH